MPRRARRGLDLRNTRRTTVPRSVRPVPVALVSRKKRQMVKGPLRTKQTAKFIYEDAISLNPAVGGTAVHHFFSANGLYDPNITGVGHQPRGFDQLMTLYDHYVVIGAKITAWITNTEGSDGNAQMYALRVLDTNSASTNPSDVMESRFAKIKALSSEGAGPNTGTMSLRINPNKFLGRSKPLSDSQLKGTTGANPTEQAFFCISAFPLPDGVDTSASYIRVRIEYNAVLIEPKIPSQS